MSARRTEVARGSALSTLNRLLSTLEGLIDAVEKDWRDGALDIEEYAQVSARLKRVASELYERFP